MTNEFDKEMDSLLRQAAQSGTFVSKTPEKHVNADEISLFAENVLPVNARTRVLEHLADCERCRKILSNVIALNSEAESENVHAGEKVGVVSVIPAIPWYKKLFAFPNMAYVMGALVLVLSGIIAVIVLRSATETRTNSIAQMDKNTPSAVAPDGESARNESYSSANSSANSNMSVMNANSNSSIMTNTTTALPKPTPSGDLSTNTNAVSSREEKQIDALRDSKTEPMPPPPAPVKDENAKTVEQEKNRTALSKVAPAPKREDSRSSENEVVTVTKEETQSTAKPNIAQPSQAAGAVSARSMSDLPINSRKTDKLTIAGQDDVTAKSEDKDKKSSAESTRTVGGKTFKRANGVWYDSAYNQQKTKNIRRNTTEYKKLDSGLRSIAENLGGTIVVVWKGKAYRIQ